MVIQQRNATAVRNILNSKQFQVGAITWFNTHRPGWRDRTFTYVGIDRVRPMCEFLMSNQTIVQQIQGHDDSIRSAADLEEMLRRPKSVGYALKWIHVLFDILKNTPRVLKGAKKNEENGLGPFADLSPDERDAKKRELWDWKLRYLNYLDRMDEQEVVEVEE